MASIVRGVLANTEVLEIAPELPWTDTQMKTRYNPPHI